MTVEQTDPSAAREEVDPEVRGRQEPMELAAPRAPMGPAVWRERMELAVESAALARAEAASVGLAEDLPGPAARVPPTEV